MDKIYSVQFVGGHADGTELSVIGLKDEFYFRVLNKLPYIYGDWDMRVTYIIETYRLLPDTTIYVFSHAEES